METRPEKLTTDSTPVNDILPIMTSDPYIGSSLQSFLQDRYVKDHGHGAEWSMTGMGKIKGKWFVSDADYDQFLDIMHDYLFVKKLRPNAFVEQRRHDGMTPFLIDLDFKYPSEKNLQRTFTNEQIQSFISEIITVLKEFFELKDRQHLRFFVSLRPQPYQDRKSNSIGKKEIKDGIHIMCPDFRITGDHATVLRQLLLERDAVKRSFDGTGYTNKDEDVYDKSLTAKNGWLFYGESKPDIPPYLLTHVFKYNTKSGRTALEPIENYQPRELMGLLSIRQKQTSVILVQDKQKGPMDELCAKLAAPPPIQQALQQVANPLEQLSGILPMIVDSFNSIVSTEDEIALAKQIAIECLNEQRADNYELWMKVGWCLRNIDSSNEMFDIWMQFSQKSGKSDGNNTEQLRRDWMRGTMRRINGSPGLTMGSLKMWAREDNPKKYFEIMDGDIISFITKTAITFKGGTHHHVAKMVHKLFYDAYKCTVEGRTCEWYEFKEHVWNPMPQGLYLKHAITDEIACKVDSARRCLKQPSDKSENWEEENKQYNDKVGKLLELQKNLYNANFKDSVIKEAQQLFYDPDFYKKMNQDCYKIGCANGILNLRDVVYDDSGNPLRYKATLSPGTSNDYISMRAGVTPDGKEPIDYVPYDANDPVQQEIMDFFMKLFPAEDLREYVLTLAAGCLEGTNIEQCFYIMTGSGGNGKSKFIELMTNTLGQYAGSLSTTALTRKRPESGAANPDIISIKGCRFIKTEEPDENEPLNSARMKQFSGEDLVEARGLFKDQERFKITGKIFLACNRMPPIHSMDGGTWRRIRVIPFDSRFLPTGDPMIDPSRHIYERDDMLNERLKSWRVPFFSLLVHYYETRYCPNGIKKVPAVVMQACENYKGSFDSFGKFVKARIRRVPGWDEPPQFKDVWKAYRNWHNDQSATGKRLTENELKIRLNETYQTPADAKTYLHLRLFQSDEEAEEYDKELEMNQGMME
jgi:P4 family phage/plasmid primase-like protien